LRGNQLEDLPPTITDLNNLKRLYLQENPFSQAAANRLANDLPWVNLLLF
jgi:Leucine-rich repeat (LRR) protein